MLILGSQSPRRREILAFFSLPFIAVNPLFDEEAVAYTGDPQSYVQTLSQGKAAALVSSYPTEPILTADTEVYCHQKIYGKPRNSDEAVQMLSELCGRWHSVFTAVTVRRGAEEYTGVEETRVRFRAATRTQLEHYQQRIHSLDKAGGYAVQGAGAILIERLEGCYFNAMGLPPNLLIPLLAKVGIDLWDYLNG